MRVAVYERISQDREGLELGVERQHEDCLALVTRERLTLHEVYRDNDRGASTRSRKPRPSYERLIADARAGKFEMVIAYTTGRLTRRPREHEDLIELAERHGIRYRFVASPSFDLNTAAGRRIARILAANDAGEAEDIAERVQREALQKAEQGRYHGGPRMFGVDRDGCTLVESEAEIVREMYAAILADGKISGIRKSLNQRGILTAAGHQWHDSSIRVILLNPRNAGLRVLHGVQYPASNPEIIPEETYRAVRAILADPGRRTNTDRTARRWLGAGLYQCERCAGRPVRTSYDGTAVKSWRVYVCGTRDGGCGRSWKAQPIDDWITDLVAGILAKEDARERLLPKPGKGIDTVGLRAEQTAIGTNMAALAVEFAKAKGATRAALDQGLKAGQERLDEIEKIFVDTGRTSPLTAVLLAADPVAVWLGVEDVARRQAIVRALMTVTLGPPIRGRATWDPRKFIRIEPKGQQ